MKTLIVAMLLAGCATSGPLAGHGRATVDVEEFRRPDRETRWVAHVKNPSPEDVLIDCDEARIRILAHTWADVILVLDDNDCDMMNDVSYSGPPPVKRFGWAKRHRMRVSP